MCYLGFLFFLVFSALVWMILVRDTRKPRGFPPGPEWKPVVGCLLEVKKALKKLGFVHLVWEDLSRRFGPIVGLRLGRDKIILVSGTSAVKRILLKEEFDARPDGFFFRLRSYNKRLGIVFVEGNHFQEQKKFCMMSLKKFGMGKRVMEDIIMKEAEDLVASLAEKCEKNCVLQMNNIFDIAVLNSLWTLMAGERFSQNDRNLGDLIELVHQAFKLLDMSGGVLNQMPFLRFIAPDATGYNKICYVLKKLKNFLENTVTEHKRKLGNEAHDLIDMFLLEMRNRSTEDGETTFSDEQLIVLLLDLFMAGTETTSNNLSMAILYMILYPEIQEKVHRNIENVVPRDRLPNINDRPRLTFVEAVLLEVQRHATVVPTSVAHRSTKDVPFDGYIIPKDATILIDLRSVLMDKNRWGDPEIFRPERFQDNNGSISLNECFIPFGQGRRRCLGEGLARSSMFILFSAIMHNFRVSRADESLTVRPQDGVTLSPSPFKAILKSKWKKL